MNIQWTQTKNVSNNNNNNFNNNNNNNKLLHACTCTMYVHENAHTCSHA